MNIKNYSIRTLIFLSTTAFALSSCSQSERTAQNASPEIKAAEVAEFASTECRYGSNDDTSLSSEVLRAARLADQNRDCIISPVEAYDLLRDVRNHLFGKSLTCDFASKFGIIANSDLNLVRTSIFPLVQDQIGMRAMAWALGGVLSGETLTDAVWDSRLNDIRNALLQFVVDLPDALKGADIDGSGFVQNRDLNEFRNRSSYVQEYYLLGETDLCE